MNRTRQYFYMHKLTSARFFKFQFNLTNRTRVLLTPPKFCLSIHIGSVNALQRQFLPGRWLTIAKKLDLHKHRGSFTSTYTAPNQMTLTLKLNLHQIQHPNYKYTPKARRMGMKKSMARIDPSALVETTYGPPATSGINITGTGNPVPQIAGTYIFLTQFVP